MIRLRILTIIVALAFTAVWARLFYWQVLSYESLKDIADRQHFHRLEIPPARGEILATDHTPLVSNQTAYLVFAEKKHVDDVHAYSQALAPILAIEEASISSALNASDVWVPIQHQVEQEKVDAIKALDLAGIGFEREDKRFYPESSMSAHVLGFVGKDHAGKPKGYFGLEGYYDKELAGQTGYLLQERDAFGDPIVIGKTERITPRNGRSLVLYLDKTVQFIAEERLKDAIDRFDAKGGSVTIMDPKTGGIIALASYPNYDPATFTEFPNEYYSNPVIADTYEPGSTFKPLIMAKALDEEVIKPKDTFNETGPVTVSGYQISAVTNEYHGNISMTDILKYSSNVGMVHIAGLMERDTIRSFLNDFGLGKKTGVDLQEEAETILRGESDWYEIDYATVSFGQGIAVTRLQMVRAFAAIANGGILMEPRMVREIVSPDGNVIKIPPNEAGVLFTPKTAKQISEMMADAVDNGPAYWQIPEGFRIAGKTGTAQVAVGGRYDEEKTIASFIGFAPVENPAFVMLVTIEEPTASPWGSSTSAPVFFDIADELFPYYGISPR